MHPYLTAWLFRPYDSPKRKSLEGHHSHEKLQEEVDLYRQLLPQTEYLDTDKLGAVSIRYCFEQSVNAYHRPLCWQVQSSNLLRLYHHALHLFSCAEFADAANGFCGSLRREHTPISPVDPRESSIA